METESEEGMLSDQGANFDDDHFQAKEITILPSKCKYLSPPPPPPSPVLPYIEFIICRKKIRSKEC